jgi:hypothetical protein
MLPCDHVILDNNNKAVLPPAVPTASATVQPTCGTPSGTITISTQSELNIAWMVRHISPLIHFAGWLRELYFICRNLAPSCVTMSGSTTTINSIPPPPVVPTTASVTQPTCAVQSGSISVTTQSGVEYSLDRNNLSSFEYIFRLDSNDYTLYVQSKW